jgi:hypothetical protein
MNQNVVVQKVGISPLLINRYRGEQLPRPKPKVKTEAWIESERKRKWIDAAHFEDGMFALPPIMIEGAVYKAAAAFRKGKDFKMAVMCADLSVPILVNRGNGKYLPLKGEVEDFYVPEFIDLRGCPNKAGQMVEQCRPIFRDWSVEFTLQYDDSLVDAKEIRQACEGMILGSFRPRFGRCSLKEFQVMKVSKVA